MWTVHRERQAVMPQFYYTRPGTGPERCPTDLCREQGNMINVWFMSDADILALDAVIRPMAARLRLGLPRDHVEGQSVIVPEYLDDEIGYHRRTAVAEAGE
jgi:hypothetical protein